MQVHQETGRHVQFLMAAHSMKRRWIGFFARLMACSASLSDLYEQRSKVLVVPVRRAGDEAKPGKGRLSISKEDSCIILGEGTQFVSDFQPRMQIMLPKSAGSASAEVVEVISDTELRIKKEFGERFSGLQYRILPVVDQSDMYRHVYQCLQDGGSIGIFPEGKHNIE